MQCNIIKNNYNIMLICHKLVVSNEAATLQACHVSPSRRACNIGSACHASVSSSLIYHFWFLKHHHSAATPNHHNRWETQLSYPWKLSACRANNKYFICIFFIICSLYLLLFLIILYRTIVTVYTDNIFLYNYLWQMH